MEKLEISLRDRQEEKKEITEKQYFSMFYRENSNIQKSSKVLST